MKRGSKHMGKGVSRQFGNSSGGGRTRSGGPVTDPKGSSSIQATDRSNKRQRKPSYPMTDD